MRAQHRVLHVAAIFELDMQAHANQVQCSSCRVLLVGQSNVLCSYTMMLKYSHHLLLYYQAGSLP